MIEHPEIGLREAETSGVSAISTRHCPGSVHLLDLWAHVRRWGQPSPPGEVQDDVGSVDKHGVERTPVGRVPASRRGGLRDHGGRSHAGRAASPGELTIQGIEAVDVAL
jgi:hypothetical protein